MDKKRLNKLYLILSIIATLFVIAYYAKNLAVIQLPLDHTYTSVVGPTAHGYSVSMAFLPQNLDNSVATSSNIGTANTIETHVETSGSDDGLDNARIPLENWAMIRHDEVINGDAELNLYIVNKYSEEGEWFNSTTVPIEHVACTVTQETLWADGVSPHISCDIFSQPVACQEEPCRIFVSPDGNHPAMQGFIILDIPNNDTECTMGTKCEGYDFYECQNYEWVLLEQNSASCGYTPPSNQTVLCYVVSQIGVPLNESCIQTPATNGVSCELAVGEYNTFDECVASGENTTGNQLTFYRYENLTCSPILLYQSQATANDYFNMTDCQARLNGQNNCATGLVKCSDGSCRTSCETPTDYKVYYIIGGALVIGFFIVRKMFFKKRRK